MNRFRSPSSLVPALALLLAAGLLAQERRDAPALAPDIAVRMLEIVESREDPRPWAEELWLATNLEHGDPRPLIEALRERVENGADILRRRAARRLLGRILRRHGDLRGAGEALEPIQQDDESVADTLAKAEILDARGLPEEALEAYGRLLGRELDAALRNRLLLRRALLEDEIDRGGGPEEASPLARFAAEEGRDPELRNRAAVVLALTERQKEAVELFVPGGEGTARFREEIRLADWAIEAGLWDEAQGHAWRGLEAARMDRDRRYALTILVEAHRRDGALGELIARFESRGAELEDVAREVWIDLLRETGRTEEALRIFRGSAGGEFTTDMRRELLEICRETGADEVLVDTYRDLIAAEPRFIEWREGLSRFLLERGDREGAREVWSDYLRVTSDRRYVMAAAASLAEIGLHEDAEAFARSTTGDPEARDQALVFLFEIELERGRFDAALDRLVELDAAAAPDSAIRKDLADAYERVGKKDLAVRVLEGLRQARGERSGVDLDMKLALLLSDVDREDDALDLWTDLWRRTTSIPRRRYVEERLMTVASRLGKLARIAVGLERKLAAGTADDRDAGLLVRLYTKVNDAVSATEIIEEHLKRQGSGEIELLQEKARIFRVCTDYYNYEKCIERLIEIDPEGRPDHLRELAMSRLERGKRDEARELLVSLKGVEGDTASDEFEAGVLALAGLKEEALRAYRRGLARHPERIDTNLLLSNTLKELGRHDLAAGMFQYLAQTADKDDLFTIAVDGILNMRDGRRNVGAPDDLVRWTRRVALERLAERSDKFYLHQLVADLSEEVNDRPFAVRALKAALPVAGEKRTPVLRELMSMSKPRSNGAVFVVINGVVQQQRGGGADSEGLLMFGRRLLGQGELVPPQVYLDLGEAFLEAREVGNAAKTFNRMSQLPEFGEMQEKIAQAFKSAGYPREALRVYERMLSARATSLRLLLEVAELHEQLGRDGVAWDLYRRGVELHHERKPPTLAAGTGESAAEEDPWAWYGGNVDEADRYYGPLSEGLIVTATGAAASSWLEGLRRRIDADLVAAAAVEGAAEAKVARFPRLELRVALFRKMSLVFGEIDRARELDLAILEAFPADEGLLETAVRARLERGFTVAARDLVAAAPRPEAEKRRLRLMAGEGSGAEVPGLVAVAQASNLLLPLLAAGEREAALLLLERLDLATDDADDLQRIPVLVGATRLLDDSESALRLGRHWLNLLATHSEGSLYGEVERVLEEVRPLIDEEQRASLVQSLVDLIVEKPEKFQNFLRQLPELQRKFGGKLITTAQAEDLIRKRLEGANRFVYGVPELFELVEPGARASVLRGVWDRIDKAQRAFFLFQLLPKLDAEIEPGFAEFLVGSLGPALGDADDLEVFEYYASQLVEGETENPTVALRFLEVLADKRGDDAKLRIFRAAVLLQSERRDEALELALDGMVELAKSGVSDYQADRALTRIAEALKDRHLDRFLDRVGELIEAEPKSVQHWNRKLALVALREDPAETLKVLEAAAAALPDDAGIRNRLAQAYRRRGDRVAVAELRAAELEDKKKREDAASWSRLAGAWAAVGNPVEVLAAREEIEKLRLQEEKERAEREAAARAAGAPDEKRAPREAATVERLKLAVEEGREDEARLEFRRLWRTWPDRSADSFFYYGGFGGSRLLWPEEKDETPDEEEEMEEERRSRGGLPERFVTLPEEAKDEEDRSTDRVSVQEVLVERTSWGEDAVLRQLRSLDPPALDGPVAGDILRGLVRLRVAEVGREATLRELLEAERAGRLGRTGYGRIFALLEGDADEGAELGETLDGLMKSCRPTDVGRLRRLARLYARSGNPARAAVLFRWCSVQKDAGDDFGNGIMVFGSFGRRSSGDPLLDDVIEYLEGEDRLAAVKAILDSRRPGPDDYWARDGYGTLAVRTWTRLLGEDRMLDRVEGTIADCLDLSSSPMRGTARLLAAATARAGDLERAFSLLEVALCKLEPPATLRYPWLRSQFENGPYVSDEAVLELLPIEHEGWADWEGWLLGIADRLSRWRDEGRLDDDRAQRMIAVVAVRLGAAGRGDAAAPLTAFLDERSREDGDLRLWYADVLRRVGRSAEADEVELRLLRERRLHPERIHEVLRRVLDAEGAAEALALGTRAAAYCRHPDLLAVLVEASEKVGDPEAAERWRAAAEEVERARQRLDQLDEEARRRAAEAAKD